MRTGRNRAAMYLMGAVLLVGIPDSIPSLAQALLLGVSTTAFFTAIFEYIPVILGNVGRVSGTSPTTGQKLAGAILIGSLVPMGLYFLYTTAKAGGINWVGALLAVTIVAFGLLGDRMIKKSE